MWKYNKDKQIYTSTETRTFHGLKKRNQAMKTQLFL